MLWTSALGILVFASAFALAPETELGLENPFFDLPASIIGPAITAGAALFMGSLIAAAASLVVRFRRSRGDERQQLKWFAVAASLVALFLAAEVLGEFFLPGFDDLGRVGEIGTLLFFMAIPVATGIAVLKYRLYDIDVVISKAYLYGTQALSSVGRHPGHRPAARPPFRYGMAACRTFPGSSGPSRFVTARSSSAPSD